MAAKLVGFCFVILNVVLHVSTSSGQGEQQQALTALSASVTKTQSCIAFLKTLSPANKAVQDCIETITSSVDHLTKSVKELGLVGKPNEDLALHVNNVKTWVSAAITDQTDCLDGLDGPNADAKLRDSIRPKVVESSQAVSSALASINRLPTK
ncbi:21 kDa protein [Cajanus cajan]|uniref:21 kDa protein n=1 Tax=Cajanus cajan TaxID=3821 RepID=A0A151SKR7_CAJCA|nr:21 kDa protein [Cajanus cajan]KYP55388.1 21 kDa protein [Cajanus cajan]